LKSDASAAQVSEADLYRKVPFWLYAAGWLLVASGIFHSLVFLIDGGSWEGSVSWRKPILFGISTGITVVSIGWIYPKLKSRFYDLFTMPVFAIAMVAEVALITLQQWRGVPSHFNRSTNFDSGVDDWMTSLIAFASLVIVDIAIRCFQSLEGTRDIKFSIRSGIVFLVFSIAIGFAISIYGQNATNEGLDPAKFGSEGVTKFPHGVAIHAIQFFPVFAFVLAKLRIAEAQRLRILVVSSIAMGLMLAFSVIQTLSGKARFDVDLIGGTLLIFAGCAGLAVVVMSIFAAFEASKEPMIPTSSTRT
jgi:hypothetical protein